VGAPAPQLASAHGATEAEIETETEQATLAQLYERLGFVRTGRRVAPCETETPDGSRMVRQLDLIVFRKDITATATQDDTPAREA
jgi:hypothetical protein